MASADIRDVSKLGEALTIEDMQGLQEEFAKEAFEFLMQNAHIWIEYPKEFLIRFSDPENGFLFTSDIAKAIITIAYFHRIEYRARDEYPINFATDLSLYEDCVMAYDFPKTENYFYFFLAWVAFIFDLTMYCYKQGYDYTDRGEQFVAKYPDIRYFHNRGGFCSLIEHSVRMRVIYDNIKPIISHKLSEDEVIVPFIKYLENIERRNRFSNNMWLLRTPEMRNSSQIRRNLSAKYAVVSSYDPRRVVPAYKVILKQSPTKSTQEISTQKFDYGEVDTLISELTSQMDRTAISEECAEDSDFPASKAIVKKSPTKSSQKDSTKSKVLDSVKHKFDSHEKDDLVSDLTSRIGKTTISEECADDSDFPADKVITKKSPTTSSQKDSTKSKVLDSVKHKFDSSEKDDLVSDLTSRIGKTTISEECADDSDFPADKVIARKSPTKSSQKVCPKSNAQVTVSPKFDSDENDDTVMDLTSRMSKTAISEGDAADCDFSASKIEPSFTWDTDDPNSVFIIHKRFLSRKKASRRYSKYKRGLKLFSPSMNSDVLSMNLNKILDTNIDNRSYMEIGDCVYAVIPPGVFMDEEDTRIIVLDTSSEEEDYDCPKSFDEIADVIWSRYEVTKCESEKDRSVLKDTGDMSKQTSEPSNIDDAKSLESTNQLLLEKKMVVSSKDTEAESDVATEIPSEQRMLVTSKSTESVLKEVDTAANPEQKILAVTKNTGAIPKVRKDALKRSPIEGHTESADLETSVQNNNNEQRQSYMSFMKSPKKD